MKLPRERVARISEALTARLHVEGYLEFTGEKRAAVDALSHAIIDELMVEDRLNAEVRSMMEAYASEIEKGRVDYQKMFTMIKAKLVKERGLIL